MARIILPSRFNIQPQYPVKVARGELSQGLKFAYIPTIPYNLVGGESSVIGSAASTLTTGLNGFEEDFTSTALRRFAVPDNANGGGLTLFVLAYSTNLSTDSVAIEGADSAGSYAASVAFRGSLAVKRPAATLGIGTYPGTSVSSSSYKFVANQWISLANVTDSSDNISLYYNGFAVASGSRTTRSTISFITIGNRYGGTLPLLGGVAVAAYWDRALSAREVFALASDPWQLFQPIPRRVWITPSGAGAENIIESLSASDSLSASGIFGTAVSESLSSADTVGASQISLGVVTETLSASDSVAASSALSGSVSETLSAADTSSATQTTLADVAETLSPSDAVTGAQKTSAAIAEALSASDTVDSAGIFSGAVTESLSASDLVSETTIYEMAVVESLSASDTVSSGQTLSDSVTESLSASDSVAATLVTSASIAEVISAGDIVYTGGTIYNDSISESVSLVDTLSTAGLFNESIVEALSAVDSVSATNIKEIFPTITFESHRSFVAGDVRSTSVTPPAQRGASR